MENTARKLTSAEVLASVKEAHGSLDLLKVFMITGATDISKSYELVKQWHRNAYSDADKANFNNALKSLQAIELKRIELTTIVYGIEDTNTIEATVVEPTTVEEESPEDQAKTILMYPKLDDILDKIRNAFKGSKNIKETKDWAFEQLKTTAGQGKVVMSDNQPVTWDNDHINSFIDSVTPNVAFGFKTIYEHITELAKLDQTEEQIKVSLANLLTDKIVANSETDQFLVKGKEGFENYYSRILSALVVSSIKAQADSKDTISKSEKVEELIAAEVIPVLQSLDKDEKQSSFAGVTKMIKKIYESLGFNKNLSDSMLKAQEIAEKEAPNLFKRNKESKNGNVPIVPQPVTKPVVDTESSIQIYDDSHNIMESNKELWAEVEKYGYLDQIFNKAIELTKKGDWRDALSMSIILISSGKIKETETAEAVLAWDNDQIHLWYHTNVEGAVNAGIQPTVDTNAEVIVETTPSVEPPQSNIGPAVIAGTLDSKEKSVKLLKNADVLIGRTFKTFEVKTDRRHSPMIGFQVLDVVEGVEETAFTTEANITKFLDEMRDHLVSKRNEQPWVKNEVFKRFSEYYDITGSEAKGITQTLVDQADAIRRAAKIARRTAEQEIKQTAVPTVKPVEVPVTTTPEVVPVTDLPPVVPVESTPTVAPTVEPIVETPVTEPDNVPAEVTPTVEPIVVPTESEETVSPPVEVPQQTVEPNENENSPETTTPTESVDTEDATNSNKALYTGFEDILKAKEKLPLHKAIYAKYVEFADPEEGKKAIFNVIDLARKDNSYKKSQIRNWKPAKPEELLEAITRIIERGLSAHHVSTETTV